MDECPLQPVIRVVINLLLQTKPTVYIVGDREYISELAERSPCGCGAVGQPQVVDFGQREAGLGRLVVQYANSEMISFTVLTWETPPQQGLP
jgi:hypothetical protein